MDEALASRRPAGRWGGDWPAPAAPVRARSDPRHAGIGGGVR